MTNLWMDIKHADVVIVMGGNSAEAHPCGFKWVIEAKVKNGARLIVVDPRFTRTASVADFYCPIRQGTDIAFLNGVTRYLLENDKLQHEYVKSYTNAGFLVRDGFDFKDGLFTGYDSDKRDYDRSTWEYEIGPDGYAVVDETMTHPRCVMTLLRKHVDPYTPEMVERICGSPREKFLHVCEMIASTCTPDRVMTSLYALGWTHHSKGSQNIRSMTIVQQLLGNIGMLGGGLNALRGHSNIQGLTDIGLMSNLLPGYMNLPTDKEPDLATYMKTRQFKPLRPGQTSYWQNYSKFFVSFMKAMYGRAATADNEYAYEYLPKMDVPTYDVLRAFELANQGKMNGYVIQGFNPLMTFPNRAKMTAALSKLKYLVVMDPLQTETARFWENHGEYNDVDPTKIQTEVFELPTTCFAEDEGSLSNSSCWLQWHWPAQPPPFEARTDIAIMAALYARLKRLYAQEGGAFPDPILNLNWPYALADEPTPDELAREINGYSLEAVTDPNDATKVLLPAGKQLDSFAQLRDDGKTACGCWVYSGCYTERGNQMARRDSGDPGDRGIAPNWAWSWPANRRVLYNRASCDPQGKPWDEKRKIIEWNGKQWIGFDVPDYGPTVPPSQGVGPFIMNQEGVSRLFVRNLMRDGPFPAHYEPFESPIVNVLAPDIQGNPCSRIFKDDLAALGTSDKFPYAATSYRLTEHFHFWTKHARVNAILQPEFFVEISEQLAAEKGIAPGSWVQVSSNRGQLKAKAVVTKRIKPLICDGKTVHVVGIPHHFGFTGATRKGWGPNSLTPVVGDANIETPEFKAWLVNVEPTSPPAMV
ncbi:MAG: formate dehydrogenase-N subunit alpha [Acetobacteraceae bacterium]|nr:formate dehydrogenase-N subunit alpha [Acetobacteraceae bacterium]